MKITLILFITGVFFTKSTFAQKWYKNAMSDNMLVVDSANTEETVLNARAIFKRIYNIKKDDWHPLYYLIFSTTKKFEFYKREVLKKKYKPKDLLILKKTLQQVFDKEINPYLNALDTLKSDTNEVNILKAFVKTISVIDAMDVERIKLATYYINLARPLLLDNPRIHVVDYLLLNIINPTNKLEIDKIKKLAFLKFNNTLSTDPYYPSWGYYYIE